MKKNNAAAIKNSKSKLNREMRGGNDHRSLYIPVDAPIVGCASTWWEPSLFSYSLISGSGKTRGRPVISNVNGITTNYTYEFGLTSGCASFEAGFAAGWY